VRHAPVTHHILIVLMLELQGARPQTFFFHRIA
jgi:hypothetical protein